MTYWTPANAGQLTSGDPLGSASCVAYSFAYAVSHATGGSVHPTGQTIRGWTGDQYGGLELSQCDRAVTAHTSVEPMTGVWTHDEFWAYVDAGWQAVLLGGYAPLEASRFSGQPGFYRNHAIWVPRAAKAGDPLADGRRAGIYRYHGEQYPRTLVNQFAAALRDSTGHNVGPNHFEASLIRTTALSGGTQQQVGHRVIVSAPYFRRYIVDEKARTVTRREKVATGGFSADATGRYRYQYRNMTLELCQLLSGARKGQWLNVNGDNVDYRRTGP